MRILRRSGSIFWDSCEEMPGSWISGAAAGVMQRLLLAGRIVEALDGSQELCRIASEYLGMDVRNMMFQDFEETEAYDGLWACASILHLTYEEIMDVMKRIHGALKPQGVFYTTFKYGTFEGERDGRYYTDFEEKKMERLLAELNCFDLERMWLTGDALPGRHEGQWINVILRRKR